MMLKFREVSMLKTKLSMDYGFEDMLYVMES